MMLFLLKWTIANYDVSGYFYAVPVSLWLCISTVTAIDRSNVIADFKYVDTVTTSYSVASVTNSSVFADIDDVFVLNYELGSVTITFESSIDSTDAPTFVSAFSDISYSY